MFVHEQNVVSCIALNIAKETDEEIVSRLNSAATQKYAELSNEKKETLIKAILLKEMNGNIKLLNRSKASATHSR